MSHGFLLIVRSLEMMPDEPVGKRDELGGWRWKYWEVAG